MKDKKNSQKNNDISTNSININHINHDQIQEEINNNQENNELSLKDKIISDYGFYATINGDDFDPREVSVLSGDDKNREITQIIKFLCDSYPIEAITYVLQRCYYNTFSHTSVLDKIIKYLLEKYKDLGDEAITNLIYSYKENRLNIDISSYNEFNNKNQQNFGNNVLHTTKLVFYDYSKEGVEYKKFMNEIFIEISAKYINKNNLLEEDMIEKEGLILEENDDQARFLGENHHLFKRFCRRKGTIYVFNFIGFENKNKKVEKKVNKKKKRGRVKEKKEEKKEEEKNEEKKEEEKIDSIAIFKCENEGCSAVYSYNFNSNRFSKRDPHSDVTHKIKEDVPDYYKQNIQLLNEKNYITDIQLVRVDN